MSTETSKLPFLLLALVAFAIAIATFAEAIWDTRTAWTWVYGAVWFRILWAAIAFSGGWLIYRRQMWKRPVLLGLHISFIVILTGAMLTSMTSQRGTLHLRQGVPETHFANDRDQSIALPFIARLDSFQIHYYPGTKAPRDYVSLITFHPDMGQNTISMNQIVDIKGYRLYQSSYDHDLQGSILTVNYDPWGIRVTYLGYAMLALCMMVLTLPKRPWKRKPITLAILLALPAAMSAQKVVSEEEAAYMERQQVIWNNRITPMGTMCQEFLLKVYGKRTYQRLTPTQVVYSMAMNPKEWSKEPIIKIGRGEYACFADFVDYSTMPPRISGVDEHNVKLAEKLGLILALMKGTLFESVPDDVPQLSDAKVRAELIYNDIDWIKWSITSSFLLALVASLARYWKKAEKVRRILTVATFSTSCVIAAFLAVAFFLRWYIAGHIPLSNGYETMLFAALSLLTASLFSSKTEVRALSGLCAGFLLLVAHLGEINPRITPLMPVLHSPWLSAHVSIIMISYALLALSLIERRLLRPAIFCLAAGIFLGAVWANVSWGTYWSWDPKESWALITMLVYCIPLHTQSLPWFQSMRNYRIYSLLALACLLMTYFGVNYVLGGMHSYAG